MKLRNIERAIFNSGLVYIGLMSEFSTRILDWYDAHARQLPWRVSPQARRRGVMPDPYRVWLSEVMLQQTTIPHGIRYFLRFTELWPTVEDLARADREDVMREWAGLGYYARARNLYACAQLVSSQGGFPRVASELKKLPGIGPYTAGAIASIAFDERVAAVDGNVERVMTRFLAIDTPLPKAKQVVAEALEPRLPDHRFGDFTQALMDLGATICTPRGPACLTCPLSEDCAAHATGREEAFPVKAPKKPKPVRHGIVKLIHNGEYMAIERRPDKGLLAGMNGLPTSHWNVIGDGEPIPEPDSSDQGKYLGRVEHVFTHFKLFLDVYEEQRTAPLDGLTTPLSSLGEAGLPSVFAKAANLLVT